MRIYAAADLHGKTLRFQTVARAVADHRPHIVVLAGDIGLRRRSSALLEALNRLQVPVLMVHGNSDLSDLKDMLQPYPLLRWIHLAAVQFEMLTLVGIGGTLPLPFYCRLGLKEARNEKRVAGMLAAGGVLVAHAPPYGVRDRVLGRFHAGSRAVRRLVERNAPALVICGHIHEQAGVGYLGGTAVVNCALGRFGGGALIDYDGRSVPECRLLTPDGRLPD